MAIEWTGELLRDLLITTKDGDWGKGEPSDGHVGYHVIRGSDFPDVRVGDLSNVPFRYLPEKTVARRTLEPNDLLIETAGGTKDRPTGRTLLVTPRILEGFEGPVTCASFARFLRIDQSKAHPAFVFWFLQHLYEKGEMDQHQIQHTGVARFQYTKFAETQTIPLPPFPEQKAIAAVLGALDDKIELNRRMNATLEAFARALFQSWFVDFDPVRAKAEGRPPAGLDEPTAALFPAQFQDSFLAEIPEGWRITTVGETCENIFSGGTPSTRSVEYWDGGIPWLSSGETRNPLIIKTEKTITAAGVENSSTRLAQAGCTVIASAGQGHTRGQTSLLTFESYINQSVIALRANSALSSDHFLFFDLARRYEEFRQLSDSHSSRGSLTTKLLAGVPCLLPRREVIEAFDRAAAPLVRQITNNLHQSRTLATLRDALLPKLLSGKLRISAPEALLEGAL